MRMQWRGVGEERGASARRVRIAAAIIAVITPIVLIGCATSPEENIDPNAPRPGRIAALRRPGPPTRILLISVAGLTSADFLTVDGYAAASGDSVRMPNLARLAREGVIGERALPPSPGSSYASHASLVTGRKPSRHRVVADARLDSDGTSATPFWDSRDLSGTALWDAAIGRGVMALGWPTTIGARIELVVPDAQQPSDSSETWLEFMKGISSPFLIHQLEIIAEDALASTSDGAGSDRSATSWPTYAERDAAFSEVACHVALSERDPGLWLIRFSQTESTFGIAGSGSLEVAAALARVDDEIGSLVDCLEESEQLSDSAIFVVGDVAYAPVHTRVDPNVALVARGLIGRDPRSSIGVRSWLAISRSQGRSAYVYAKDEKNAMAARDVLEAEAKETDAFRVVSATELAKTDVDPQAWFGLEAKPGFVIGNGLMKPVLRPAEVRASAGALRAEDDDSNSVGFVAWGRGIRGHVRIAELDLVDVAPTIAMLLGFRLDDSLDGRPIAGILRAATPPPPIGPERIGVGNDGDIDRTLNEMGGGR